MSECFYGRVYHILGRLQRFSYVTIHKRFPLYYTLPVKSSGRAGTAPDQRRKTIWIETLFTAASQTA
jgi:hypothetical protein